MRQEGMRDMDIIEQYIDELMEKSTPENPVWNIEKILQGKKADWNYVDGCMIKAILEMYAITKEAKYLDFADEFIDYRVHEDGTIDGYDVEELNIDSINAGKTLFELYDLTRKEKYRKAIDLVYSQVEKMPRTKEGNFWHKKIYPNQVWLDGLYMCQPFYMEYETRFNGKKNYDDIYRQFFSVVQMMRDSETGLYYHAYDSSRKMFWCDKVTGLSQNFWLRALGWYSMALLDTLDKADPSWEGDTYGHHAYERLKEIFKDFIDSLLRYQDESGMWYQVVNLGGMDRNYLETSGSAILSYAILKGVRLGFLPEEYTAYGKRAFEGICEKYLHVEMPSDPGKTEKKGGMSLGGICLVAGLGGNGRRSGTYDYYMSEPVVKDDAKGVGPFLLAYTEMRRLEESGAGTKRAGEAERAAADRRFALLESGETALHTSDMPFYADYDTKYRKNEHYGTIAAVFQETLQNHRELTGREMADLIDTISSMSMMIYEYYRELCDLFRQQVREKMQQVKDGAQMFPMESCALEACELAYAILKACNLGILLGEKYAPAVVKAWEENRAWIAEDGLRDCGTEKSHDVSASKNSGNIVQKLQNQYEIWTSRNG